MNQKLHLNIIYEVNRQISLFPPEYHGEKKRIDDKNIPKLTR